ncbi:MAG: Arm DNA-binding domain-containing protein [Desulfovibrio sp.]|nr:Arm DNA-binding domain-containing protein [Desulfovibrio sp.]
MPPLTEVYLRAIKVSGKLERHADAGGLYLEMQPSGKKYWRWKYRFQGKENRLSFGDWPTIIRASATFSLTRAGFRKKN